MRRVVVTGLGLISPLGSGVKVNWERLIAGESGISAIQSFDVSDLPSKIAGQLPLGDALHGRGESPRPFSVEHTLGVPVAEAPNHAPIVTPGVIIGKRGRGDQMATIQPALAGHPPAP